ncbi:ABC transporter permease [Clostridium sp. DJ247]|uniref:ABC transporter permease n=1 Tax=Clostridium sp. DJ247 TaxID=2726188 RepID=UPI0028BD649B|nr:ABC transporter permease [Clostridium sp. DJ247]
MMLEDIKQLFEYREMLNNLVRKDLRTRYKGSVLGFLWTFVNPLLQLVVYTIVFSTVMRMNIEKYPMFLFVALLPWIFFANSIQFSAGIIISNKDLVKKIYFPREVLPIALVNSGLMNLLFGFMIVFPALLISRIHLTYALIALPLVILVEYILTLAFSMLFSCLNVYFRDLEHILGIFIMAWFYLTPIVFPVEMVPKKYLNFFFLNPMTVIINSFRDILYYGKLPDIKALLITLITGLLMLIFSYSIFKKLQRNFAEEI